MPNLPKKTDIYQPHKIEDSIFKDSRIIDLTVLDYNNIHSIINDYIFSNYKLLFQEDIPLSILSEQILQEIAQKEKYKIK